ncbi:hypothetical protein CXG81DRAFT_11038 [Caulochytrium protostelioides]|uniref:non-specific serine/threonine protein kinase n=1 Tax=Caulochytrium protostelioides TaxID=1555241 RepID=A0A4P9XAR9_9FUNG|nr:hypothetical protein CXG81DRAFT_11038 [Caulochytrium protostelioides]|eukprot:RKP02191.1 hypothetical protein CXG81DRAFT_11038 [Caulochytrium protostelioides]
MLTLWSRASRVGDEEHFLGMMRVRPPHIAEKVHDNWFRLLPRVWRERVKGEIHLRIKYIPAAPAAAPMQASDFEVLKMLGKGNFGKVLQVRKKDTGRIYAMKILIKKDVVEKREVQHTLSERNVLIQATSPFLVGLKFAFQTPEKLYLVLDFMNGGELFYHLQSETAFSESRARFYTAELISAIAHLHRYNIIYRDLKPENILLDSNGHIALTDFGLCKENISADKITNTFCGTAEYLAPEVLLGRGYGKPVDWWSLGILFYEMTTGLPPFFSENTNMMFKKILHAEVTYPASFPPGAKAFVQGLLTRDPRHRLGTVGGSHEVMHHSYMADIDWNRLEQRQIQPPFKPAVTSDKDSRYFDPQFTEAVITETIQDGSHYLSQTTQNNFVGFSYRGEATPMANTSHLH